MTTSLPAEVLRYLEESREEFLPLLETLTAIPAPTGREQTRAAWCLDWLRRNGVEDAYLDAAGNVLYPHRCQEGPITVFMAHLDTVFPDDAISLRREGSRIYAPGIGDDTANLAVLLMLCRFAARHPHLCPAGILFAADVGEEGEGNLRGCRQVFADYGSRVETFIGFDGYFGHYTVLPVGSQRYRVTVRTEGGHSYQAFGNANAIHLLSGMIARLYRLNYPSSPRTTCNVGRITGGTSVNSIAQEASMLWEFRSESAAELERLETEFRAIAEDCRAKGGTVTVEDIGRRPCMGTVDAARQAALTDRCTAVLRRYCPALTPESGSTDANIPWSMGIPSITLGCVATGGAHTYQEWIDADQAPEGLALGLELLLGC